MTYTWLVSVPQGLVFARVGTGQLQKKLEHAVMCSASSGLAQGSRGSRREHIWLCEGEKASPWA